MEASFWMIGSLVGPLIAALLCFVVGKHRAHLVGVVGALVGALTGAGLVWQTVHGGSHRHSIGAWGAPLGIDVYADGLAVTMVAMNAVVGSFVSVYAAGYFSGGVPHPNGGHDQAQRIRTRGYFWPLWMLLWTALNALFLSADLFNMYVGLELMGLTAVALVALSGPQALAAAMRYLLVTLAGSLFYLMGVALVYSVHGTLDWASLGRLVQPAPAEHLALALMTGGMLLKTALFPLHFWLPTAHGRALAPVSALLSGLVIGASFYVLLRLWTVVFPGLVIADLADLVSLLGMSAVLWGSFQAIRQERLKLLVAYSTVAQVGYLFVIFSPALRGAPAALIGGVYHALSHACAKAAMFLAAGTLVCQLGDDAIVSLRGVREHVSLSLFTFGLAGINLIGLPPSGGFIAKLIVGRAAIDAGHWAIVAVIFGGGLLTAIYVFKVLRTAFVSPDPGQQRQAARVPLVMHLAPLLLALIALVLGLLAWMPLELLDIGEPFAGAFEAGRQP